MIHFILMWRPIVRKLQWILLLMPQRVRKLRLRTPGVQATFLPLNHGAGLLQRAILPLGIQKSPEEKVSDSRVSLFASLTPGYVLGGL